MQTGSLSIVERGIPLQNYYDYFGCDPTYGRTLDKQLAHVRTNKQNLQRNHMHYICIVPPKYR